MNANSDFTWDWYQESPKAKLIRLFEEEQRATSKQEKQRIWEEQQKMFLS